MKRKWYRLSEQIPPNDEKVHVWGEKCGIGIAIFNKLTKCFVDEGEVNYEKISHWMPFPEEPRKSRR
jgi:hypothetical protein